ncbi:MAG TPA: MlaD family protein [Solirubrobacteraceae bacterium]|nr:MlaD family protein [Solirubrobacteraceae bacterium]
MNRRGAASIAANPVLIGAATTLIVVVAVFLAYNANNGLPFVPTYDLKVVVPNAANLVPGNEVRVGGSRVGVIDEITPRREPNGAVSAVLNLKLETVVDPLPRDSTVLVRSRSALGMKYLELNRGDSTEGFVTGDTVPLAQATPAPVEIDEVLGTFDEPTRAASRTNMNEFGGALSARGESLNDALGSLPGLLRTLQPVMANLADPRTDLEGFFRGLGQAAAEAAPVGREQASLFRGLDTTFTALSDVREGLQETISTGPRTMQTAIDELPRQRPVLRNAEALFSELRPGVRAISSAAPDLAQTFTRGRTVLRESVELNERLEPTFRSLQEFAEDPLSTLGIRSLRTTVQIARPTVADLAPLQTVCNYASLFFRNAASVLSEGTATGTWGRFIIISSPEGPNNEGTASSSFANGGTPENFLHTNPYPNTPGNGRTNECEAGNENWVKGRPVIGNVPGNQGRNVDRTERATTDGGGLSQSIPGDQGGGTNGG